MSEWADGQFCHINATVVPYPGASCSEVVPLPIKGYCADAHKLYHACHISQGLMKQN